MHVEGLLAPATAEEARAEYDALAPAAKTVVRETAKAMSFDRAEYDERVTADVVETALDALFASLLEVHVGTRGEFEQAREAADLTVDTEGSDEADRVVWHAAPAADLLVAATFHDAEEAAVGTLRRQAFGKAYRELL